MSFSSDAKAELCRVPLTRRCCARAEAYGVLLYAGSFSPTEVRIVTESEDFAARLPKLFQKAFSVRFDAQESGSKSIFRITDGQKLAVILEALGYDPDQHYALHVNFALLEEECCRASFLRGAFLAGGSVTDPLKRYHLELATPHLQAGREGEALLRATPPNGADALRRAIAQHLYRFRGISAAPEQIVGGAGTTLRSCSRASARPPRRWRSWPQRSKRKCATRSTAASTATRRMWTRRSPPRASRSRRSRA